MIETKNKEIEKKNKEIEKKNKEIENTNKEIEDLKKNFSEKFSELKIKHDSVRKELNETKMLLK